MKFLEVETIANIKFLINLEYINYLSIFYVDDLNETMYRLYMGRDVELSISKEEYERITQYIDKVDHL